MSGRMTAGRSGERCCDVRMVLLLLCMAGLCMLPITHVAADETGVSSDLDRAKALGRRMYMAADEPRTAFSTAPYPLERLAERYTWMVYGKVTHVSIDLERIEQYISEKRLGPIFVEATVEVYRQHPETPAFDVLAIRQPGNHYILSITHDPSVVAGQEYFIFFDEETEHREGVTHRPSYFSYVRENLAYSVLEADDFYNYSNRMTVDDAWAYLVNQRELAKGRGEPITDDQIMDMVVNGDESLLLCALILMKRMDKTPHFTEAIMNRIEEDIRNRQFSPTERRSYRNMLSLAMQVLRTDVSEDIADRLYALYEDNPQRIFRTFGRDDFFQSEIYKHVIKMVIDVGGPKRDSRLLQLASDIAEERSLNVGRSLITMERHAQAIQDKEAEAFYNVLHTAIGSSEINLETIVRDAVTISQEQHILLLKEGNNDMLWYAFLLLGAKEDAAPVVDAAMARLELLCTVGLPGPEARRAFRNKVLVEALAALEEHATEAIAARMFHFYEINALGMFQQPQDSGQADIDKGMARLIVAAGGPNRDERLKALVRSIRVTSGEKSAPVLDSIEAHFERRGDPELLTTFQDLRAAQ